MSQPSSESASSSGENIRSSVSEGADATSLLDAMPARIEMLVESWAQRTPDSTALVSLDKAVTYAELWGAIQRAKELLIREGVRPGDRVLIVCENSLAAAAYIFASTACNAWACPINARMLADEIERCRSYAGCRIVVYTSEASPAASAHAKRVQARDVQDEIIGLVSVGQFDADVVPEPMQPDKDKQTAILLFSSGTTGLPKGIMISHQAIMYMGGNLVAWLGFDSGDTFYNVAPMSHIIGLGLLSTAMWVGGTAELVPQFTPKHLVEALQQERVTYVMGVPMIFTRVLEYARVNGLTLRSQRLRFIALGGMPLDLSLRDQIEAVFGVPVANAYGMTEISPVTRTRGTIAGTSVGQAQSGVVVRVVDAEGVDVPVGERGDIWVKGPSLMLGYYRDETQTAAAMKPGGFFSTGDLGVMDESGDLTIVGREKDVIIRSGFNVYPVEVEAVLSQYPGVAAVAVVGRAVPGNEEVVAYVQPQLGHTIDLEALEDYARNNLTAYKRPAEICVTTLPIGPSGKVMKAKLKMQLENSSAGN